MRARSMAFVGVLTALMIAAVTAPFPARAASAGHEKVVLVYPSFLTWDPRADAWRGTVKGRVFERGPGPAARLARAALRAALGAVAKPTKEEEPLFDARAEQFAVDSEHGERVVVTLRDRSFVSSRTLASGHFLVDVALAHGAAGATVPFRARLDRDGAREIDGTLRLLGSAGVSVISDVDDTVKVSNVSDHSELVANTFYRPYRAVSGMPGLYAEWRARDVAIHYVTASPWQLFTPLWDFLTENGIAGVSVEMREARLSNASVLNLARDSRAYKTSRIREILRRFPERSFVLVGDSGERDPEVYAAIARENPLRVRGIFIRAVSADHLDRTRYRGVFAGLEETRWIVFGEVETLPRDLPGWVRSGDSGS